MRSRIAIICACILGPFGLWAASPLVSTAASPSTKAASLDTQITATRGKIQARKHHEQLLTTDISAYSNKIDALQNSITSLQRKEDTIQGSLDAKRALLERTQAELRQERARLARLKAHLVLSRKLLANRLVQVYKSDQPDLMTVVLQANGFADLLERGTYIGAVSDQDRRIISRVRSARLESAAATRRFASLESRQQHVAAQILQQRNEVAGVKGKLVGKRSGFARVREGKQALLASNRATRHKLQDHLDELQADAQRVRQQIQAAQNSGGGGGAAVDGPIRRGSGSLIWPVNGPITSPFCERRAWEACHPGIDIGVPAGTPIRAADNGHVDPCRPQRRLWQLHLRPAHGDDVHLLRPPVGHQGLGGPEREPGAGDRPLRLYGPVLRCTPPLRGAHQRQRREPAQLPVAAAERRAALGSTACSPTSTSSASRSRPSA